MTDEPDDPKGSPEKFVHAKAGALRDYFEFLQIVEARAIAAKERADRHPHPVDYPNDYETLPDLCKKVREDAEFLVKAANEGAGGHPFADEETVALSLSAVREWIQGLMAQGAQGLLAELGSAAKGLGRDKSLQYQNWVLVNSASIFHEKTGITLEDLEMITADVVEKEEFEAIRNKQVPKWIPYFCKLYGHDQVQAMEGWRRKDDPGFSKENSSLLYDFDHFQAYLEWQLATQCLRYVCADPESEKKVTELFNKMQADPLKLTIASVNYATWCLKAIDEEWRQRHGEPPPDAGGGEDNTK